MSNSSSIIEDQIDGPCTSIMTSKIEAHDVQYLHRVILHDLTFEQIYVVLRRFHFEFGCMGPN